MKPSLHSSLEYMDSKNTPIILFIRNVDKEEESLGIDELLITIELL